MINLGMVFCIIARAIGDIKSELSLHDLRKYDRVGGAKLDEFLNIFSTVGLNIILLSNGLDRF